MKSTTLEALWLRLHTELSTFSERVEMIAPSLISDLGHSKNDAFQLRAYLAFRRNRDGEEVAITVDVQSDEKRMKLSVPRSGVCGKKTAVTKHCKQNSRLRKRTRQKSFSLKQIDGQSSSAGGNISTMLSAERASAAST